MEETDVKNIWQAYERKIEESRILNLQSWALNFRAFESIQQHKAGLTLNALAGFKVRALVLGFVWTLFLGILLYGARLKNLYFSFSIGALFLFNIATLVIYIRQVVLIKWINYSDPITDTQKKLSLLASSTVGLRFLWLQMPFYCTWFWHSSWIDYSSLSFWLITFPITLFFTFLGIFLYRNVVPENMHKKWVQALLMSGPEYKSVIKAKEFLAEIDNFQKELS